MDAKGIGEVLKNVEAIEKKESKISKHGTNNDQLKDIEEKNDGDSSVESSDHGGDSDSGSDSSSIDMDNGDDEQKLYQQILKEQENAKQLKEAKEKGEHVSDLID